MAITNPDTGFSTFTKTSGTTIGAALNSAPTVGNILIAYVIFDNAASTTTPTVSSITKPAGETNSWVKLGSYISTTATAGGGVLGEIWGITLSTATGWTGTSAVTVTLSASVNAKILNVEEYGGATLTLRSTSGTGTSTTGAPVATSSGTTPVVGDLAVGLIGYANTTTLPNLPTGWTAETAMGTSGGSGATNITIRSVWREIASAAHVSVNPSASASVPSGAAVVVLQQAIPIHSGTADLTATSTLSASREPYGFRFAGSPVSHTGDTTITVPSGVNTTDRCIFVIAGTGAVPATLTMAKTGVSFQTATAKAELGLGSGVAWRAEFQVLSGLVAGDVITLTSSSTSPQVTHHFYFDAPFDTAGGSGSRAAGASTVTTSGITYTTSPIRGFAIILENSAAAGTAVNSVTHSLGRAVTTDYFSEDSASGISALLVRSDGATTASGTYTATYSGTHSGAWFKSFGLPGSSFSSAGPPAVTGSAPLAATSTLTASASATNVASASLTAASTLTADGTLTRPGSASLTATSSLSATASSLAIQSGSAALEATSALSASGSAAALGDTSLTASSSLTATATPVAQAAADLSATSTLSASGVLSQVGAADLTAVSTLTVDGDVTAPASVALTAESSLSATAVPTLAGYLRSGTNSAFNATSSSVTVPTGTTAEHTGLFIIAGSAPTPGSVTLAKDGVTFSTVVPLTLSNNMWYFVATATGLVAGDVVTITTTAAQFTIATHHYFDTTFEAPGTLYSRAGVSGSTTVAPSMTASGTGRRVWLISIERTLADASATGIVNSNGRTVTQDFFVEEPNSDTSVLLAHFDEPGSTTGTTTTTYGAASGNGAAFHLPMPFSSVVTAEGAADLSAVSTLTVAATPVVQASAALTATSTLTADGTTSRVGSVDLVAASAMTAGATPTVLASAALAAASTLVATATPTVLASAALSATSTLTALGEREVPASAALVAVSTLAATATPQALAQASLVAASTLSATGTLSRPGVASLSASSALTADAVLSRLGTVALSAASTLTSDGTPTRLGGVALSATATLVAAATAEALASASLTATSTLSTSALVTVHGQAALQATSTMTVDTQGSVSGVAALTATSTLVVAATTTGSGSVVLAASPSLSVSGVRTALGVVALAATSTMDVSGAPVRLASAALVASSALTAAGTVGRAGTVALAASSTLSAAATVGRAGAVALEALSELSASGALTSASGVTLTATSAMVAGGAVARLGDVALLATSLLLTDGDVIVQAAIALAAESALTADADVIPLVVTVALLAASALYADAEIRSPNYRDISITVGVPTLNPLAAGVVTLGLFTAGAAALRGFTSGAVTGNPLTAADVEPNPLTAGAVGI